MEGYDFSKIDRVTAPPDFEAAVLAKLPAERRARARQRVHMRLAFAGTAAAVLAGFFAVNTFVLEKRTPSPVVAEAAEPGAAAKSAIAPGPDAEQNREASPLRVLERVDYSQEFRNVSYDPRTVYILEQVSEGTPPGITF